MAVRSKKPKVVALVKSISKRGVEKIQEEKDNQIQALEHTNEKHQQCIEEKDTTIALLNDDLKNREHDNAPNKEQLQKCQDIIANLKKRHVPHAKDLGKENIVMIIEKNTTSKEDEFYEFPYFVARIQPRFINTKKQWFKAQYPNHNPVMEELDNANGIHTFNRFGEEGFVERFQCHFRLVDIPYDAFYALVTPATQ